MWGNLLVESVGRTNLDKVNVSGVIQCFKISLLQMFDLMNNTAEESVPEKFTSLLVIVTQVKHRYYCLY